MSDIFTDVTDSFSLRVLFVWNVVDQLEDPTCINNDLSFRSRDEAFSSGSSNLDLDTLAYGTSSSLVGVSQYGKLITALSFGRSY